MGQTYCRECGELVKRDPVSSVDLLQLEPEGTKSTSHFRCMITPGHSLKEELDALKKRGFFRIIFNGEFIDLNETDFKAKSKKGILRSCGPVGGEKK